MSIFYVIKGLNQLKENASKLISEAEQCINTASRELMSLEMLVRKILIRWLVYSNTGNKEAMSISKQAIEANWSGNYKSYNPYNCLVAIKLYIRKSRTWNQRYYDLRREFEKVWNELETYEQLLLKSKRNRRTNVLLEEIRVLKEEILEYQINRIKESEFVEEIQHIFQLNGPIPKEDLLSLISVFKGRVHWDGNANRNYESINQLPSFIDYDTFYDLIMIDGVEADYDCCFKQIYMKRDLKIMEEMKEAGEELEPLYDEVLGAIERYKIVRDRYGNVLETKVCRPKLRLIK